MMKKIFPFASIILLLFSCTKSGNLTVSGSVIGLKKGTIYLQHIKDTSLVNLDSLIVDGDPDFEFVLDIKEPEVYYLHLDKANGTGYDDRIPFFAEAGKINIATSLKNFEGFAAVTGSENQMYWQEYKNMSKQFNDRNLDLLKGSFEARRDADQELILAYDDSLQNLIKRKYLYTGNFAATRNDLEIAPYIILTQIPDANTAYLDTIYNKFTRKIKKSMYGRELKKLIGGDFEEL